MQASERKLKDNGGELTTFRQVGVHTLLTLPTPMSLTISMKWKNVWPSSTFSFACILLLQMLSHIVTKFCFCLLQSDINVIMTDFSADPIGSFGDKYEELLRCCLIIGLKLLRKSLIQQIVLKLLRKSISQQSLPYVTARRCATKDDICKHGNTCTLL